jgi:hypothetical protein
MEAKGETENSDVRQSQATIAFWGANDQSCDLAFSSDHRIRPAPQKSTATLINLLDSPRRK